MRSSPCAQVVQPLAHREGAVDERHLIAEALHHHLELAVRDERAFQHQDFGLRVVLVQHVPQVAEPGLQATSPGLRASESIGGFVTWLKFCRK